MTLLVALLLSALVPAATAQAGLPGGVMQAQGLSGVEVQPLSTPFWTWESEDVVYIPVGTTTFTVEFNSVGSHNKIATSMAFQTSSANASVPLTFQMSGVTPPAGPWLSNGILTRSNPSLVVASWNFSVDGAPWGVPLTANLEIPAGAQPGTIGTVSNAFQPTATHILRIDDDNNVLVSPTATTTTVVLAHFRDITLNAGPSATFQGVTLPEGWTMAAGGGSVTRSVAEGTAWNTIEFPEPVRTTADGYLFDGWNPARPTGNVGTENFTTTAVWESPLEIRLNAGAGGTFQGVTLPEGWTMAAGGASITRMVEAGTAWSTIDTFPVPVRVNPADGFTFREWDPAQPTTGDVTANFTTEARWDSLTQRQIVLNAGDGGTFATAPAGWTLGANGASISRTVDNGTPWAMITFPTPGRATADGYTFNVWSPERPTGPVEADFATTAEWRPGITPTHIITLNAGTGGIFPAAVSGEWTRSPNGAVLTREVAAGTAWSSIHFPTPERVNDDGFVFDGWFVVPPTGPVTEDFMTGARWRAPNRHQIVLNAGVGGTFATAPAGWALGPNGASISRIVDEDTPWGMITFPTPSRATADGYTFNVWNPERPTGLVDDDFATTAQWNGPDPILREITLNAGVGATFPLEVSGEWTRLANGAILTREVAQGTAWSNINFPTPVRMDDADGFTFRDWSVPRPVGNVTANFASTAEWNPREVTQREIVLHAGNGGTFATAPELWTRAVDGSHIFRVVNEGTAWNTITFPLPTRATADSYVFNTWNPAQLTGNVTANFTTTAEWRFDGPDPAHVITLNAGPGGTFQGVTLTEGWTLAAGGASVTREVAAGTAWNLISTFPEPVRTNPADNFEFTGWEPAQPTTGDVPATFTTAAQWSPPGPTHLIVLNAGTSGTFAAAPADWTLGTNGAYIFRTVANGTAWNTISFPLPTANTGYSFNVWSPAQPTGNVTAPFITTAAWIGDSEGTFDIVLNAGVGGTFPTTGLGEWTRSANGAQLTRRVGEDTPWASITFPAPERVNAADNFTFREWTPAQPTTGNVTDFTTTAQWTSPGPTHLIALSAGDNGTFPTAPTGWTLGTNGAYIFRTVSEGTLWAMVTFPVPTGNTGYRFNTWNPERPTGAVTEDFGTTATWIRDIDPTFEIVLHAGAGGTFPAEVSGEWTRTPNGAQLTRTVGANTPWADITFPTPAPAGEVEFVEWTPTRPTTGNVTDFESTAQWRPIGPGGNHLVVLNAGDGGIFQAAEGWTLGANGAHVFRVVAAGTAWSTITFPEPVRVDPTDDYEFDGWAPEQPTGNVTTPFDSTAQWAIDVVPTHLITLNAGAGGVFPDAPAGWTRSADSAQLTRTVIEGTAWNTITFPEPVRVDDTDDYVFIGWQPVRPSGAVTTAFTSTAQWEDNPTHLITLNAGTGAAFPASVPTGWERAANGAQLTRRVEVNTPWSAIGFFPMPVHTTPEYFAFSAWSELRPTGGLVTADFTATAVWIDLGDGNARTITLHAGTGGTFPENVPAEWTRTSPTQLTRTVAVDTAWNLISFPTPVRAGFTFTWNPVQPTGNVTTDFTSTAQWTGDNGGGTLVEIEVDEDGEVRFRPERPPGTTVVTNPEDGETTITLPPGVDVDEDDITTPPGWDVSVDRDGDNVIVVLTPPGIQVNMVQIGWNLAGGTWPEGFTPPASAAQGSQLAALAQNPVREGHTFMGWRANGQDVTFPATITGPITFFAHWVEGTPVHRVTFNSQRGTAVAHQDVLHGQSATLPTVVPTRDRFIFAGWFAHATEGTTPFDFSTPITQPTTIFARWQVVGNYIVIDVDADGTYEVSGTNNVETETDDRGTITFTFPPGTNPENIVVNAPDSWDYTITTDRNGNVIVTASPNVISDRHRAFLVGFPDGTIRPQATLTRAEAATIFFRLLDDDFRAMPAVWRTSNQFADVQTNNWFNNAASTMANLNVVRGTSSTTFAPNSDVTNAQFYAMLVRFIEAAEDEEIALANTGAHWAAGYARVLEAMDLIPAGTSTNSNFLDRPIARAEVARLVNRGVTERVVESRAHLLTGPLRRTWTDLSTNAPYYLDMVKAGHTVEWEAVNQNTAGDWIGVQWVSILPHVDWTVLERPTSRPQDINQAIAAQEAQIERFAGVAEFYQQVNDLEATLNI